MLLLSLALILSRLLGLLLLAAASILLSLARVLLLLSFLLLFLSAAATPLRVRDVGGADKHGDGKRC